MTTTSHRNGGTSPFNARTAMKKTSKYSKMFDPLREVLIEYATARDDKGRLLHPAKEIMLKFGFGTDPAVVDGFNRWLNRRGIFRNPKPKRTAIKVVAECVDDLSPALKSLEGKAAELFPQEASADVAGYFKTSLIAVRGIRRSIETLTTCLDVIDGGLQLLADEYGLNDDSAQEGGGQ